MPKFNKIILSLSGVLLILLIGSSFYFYKKGYRINFTESYPLGVYKYSETNTLKKGDMVLFCPPKSKQLILAHKRGYLASGMCPSGFWALQKKIVGMPGDHVQISNYVYINGSKIKNTNVYRTDPQGGSMDFMSPKERDIIIPPGKMFVVSDYNKYSFDSRYFGLVDQNTTLGITVPIFTLSEEAAKNLKSY